MEAARSGVKKVGNMKTFGLYSGIMNKKYFAFLRRLQAKGRSNMYGAVPYLMRAFGLERERAFAVVCEWIDLQQETPSKAPAVVVRHAERTKPTGAKRRKLSRAMT
jgi:hypothetical protein